MIRGGGSNVDEHQATRIIVPSAGGWQRKFVPSQRSHPWARLSVDLKWLRHVGHMHLVANVYLEMLVPTDENDGPANAF